ncbi:MAG: hypothetical protein TREMPRED_002680 [Tremellales sp. Tagirdzhanova-0007]|nr:MAG: hypothetical protein TREMPRED_002680 [Tremellales sp. Tagirdzhanova-0007]
MRLPSIATPSSHLGDGPSSSSSSATWRPPRRRLTYSVVIYALSLCVPYVSASPVSETAGLDGSRLHSPSSTSRPAPPFFPVMSIPRTASRTAAMYLAARNTSTPTIRPIVTLASVDRSGYYQVPEGFIQLSQHFDGGFIVLSYAIAFVGSLCTLELLTRRTTNSGWRNQVLLLSAGVTFGAVSTFSMHFIFNNSLSLHHPLHAANKGYPAIYLAYDAGFTVLSLVVSCSAMTIAFFIMGTHLHDWYIVFGRPPFEKTLSHPSSPNGVDEYGKWKSSQKVLKKGSTGVGALLQRAGTVAKWSLMDVRGNGDHRDWNPSSRRTSKVVDKWNWDDSRDTEEAVIKQDKRLQDLDFRFGRSAVKLEMERRQASSENSAGDGPTYGESRVRLVPSNSSLSRSPLPVFHTPGSDRNPAQFASVSIPATSSTVFTPGFEFPARPDPASSASLIFKSATISAYPAAVGASKSLESGSELPSALPSGPSRRRASLSAAILRITRPDVNADISKNGLPLTRIQSLSESEQSQSPITPATFDRQSPPIAKLPMTDNRLEESRDPLNSGQRRPVFHKPAMSILEKFLGFDVVTAPEIIKVLITGTIAGFGVAGMHYIGQLSIIGMPYIAYKAPYVVGSVIIASGAVIVALYIMFIMLRPKLKHTWISKLAVAAILAIAVCAMHFCGMMGTIYAWPRNQGITGHVMLQGANRAITAIVATIAFIACLACGIFFFLHSLRLKKERARRRRVVVAAVLLDSYDRVLVDATDGVLPMCDIASLTGSGEFPGSKRSIRSALGSVTSDTTVLGMDLTPGHDAFVSALRMSWSWKNSSVNLPDTIASASESTSIKQPTPAETVAEIRRGSSMTMDSTAQDSRQTRVSVTKFLERFTFSASQLASRLKLLKNEA